MSVCIKTSAMLCSAKQMNLCTQYDITIVCVCVRVCVYVGSQAVHCGVIAVSEFAALDYCNLLPRECRALWENRKQECVCVHVCVFVCVLALWEKCACSERGHNTAFSLPCTSY